MRPRLLHACLIVAATIAAGRAEDALALRAERPRLLGEHVWKNLAANAGGELSWALRNRVLHDCDVPLDPRRLEFTLGNSGYLWARTLGVLAAHRLEPERYRNKALAIAGALAADTLGRSRRDARVRLQALALLYDGLYNDLDAAQRDRLRSALLAAFRREVGSGDFGDASFVSGHGHFTTASIVVAGLALADGTGEVEGDLARAVQHWEKFVEVARHVGVDGGHHLGWRYGRSYAARLVWLTELLSNATGRDRFEAERPWLSQLGYHLVYGLRPDFTYLRVGDTHRAIHVNLDEDVLLLGILSSRYRDGRLAWFGREIASFLGRSRALVPDAQHTFALLFLDPAVRPEPPAGLPLARAFVRAGNYILRTGWEADDTVVLFRAMPWYHFNHEHRDFGSFLIYRQGGLAVDGGVYMAGDEESLYGGSHARNYAWRTVAHNTITVFDPNERFCSPTGKDHERCEGENRWSNDGGQKVRSRVNDDVPVPAYQPRDVADIEDPRFAQGKVTAFEDAADYTLVIADGTRAYRADKVKQFERSLVLLRRPQGWAGPLVIVFDRVVAADPSFRKAWLLHAVEAPGREGDGLVVANSTRVRFSGQEAAKPNDHWHQYSGKMHVQSLLPAGAEIEFIGGEGKEFWVSGANYPAEVREIDRIIEPGIGRIEVRPPAAAAEDLFLHMLAPVRLDDPAPRPAARLLVAQNATAMEAAGWVVVFAAPAAAQAEVVVALEEAGTSGPRRCLVTGLLSSRTYAVATAAVSVELRSSTQGALLWSLDGAGRFTLRPR